MLCRVQTAEEVKEYCGAFMQVYREEARYLERTAPWVERVGLTYIKGRVVDDAARRKTLYERFLASQKLAQVDPWKERAAGAGGMNLHPWPRWPDRGHSVVRK